MVSRINHSQAFLGKAGLGSRVDLKTAANNDRQTNPYYRINSRNNSKPLLELEPDRQYSLEAPNIKSFMVSPINKKLSPKPQTATANSFFLPPRTSKNSSLGKLPNMVSRDQSRHGTMLQRNTSKDAESAKEERQVFSKKDYTSEAFLIKLMSGLSKNNHNHNRLQTAVAFGRIAKQVSVKHANRILRSLADSLKFLKDYKFGDITNMKNTNHRASTDIDEPHVKLAKFDKAIEESLNLCNMTMNERSSSIKVDQYTRKIIEEAQTCSNSEFILYSLYVQGKICMARCDFKQAITEFKHFKELCSTYNVFGRRLCAYKMLGICYQNMKMHKAALIYFTKFLYMAWHLDSPKHELLAYDFIGLQYYYLGVLDRAEYFHNRMVGGKLEPKLSRIRHIGVTKIKLNKTSNNGLNGNKNFDFDDNFDIDLHWGQNVDANFREDDEAAEVSGRDEGFEPPMSNLEEEFEGRYGSRMNMLSKKRATIKTIPGFVKAKVTILRKNEEKERKRVFTFSKGQGDSSGALVKERSLLQPNPRSTSSCFNNSKPNEQIFTSHLSRNRGLKNFSVLGATSTNFGMTDKSACNEDLDSKSSEQVKKIIEKVKSNLEIVKANLNNVYTRPLDDEDYY